MSEKIIEFIDTQAADTLGVVYENFTKDIIVQIAKIHGVKKYSALKKDELIEHTVSCILAEDTMERYFLFLKEVEYKSFLLALKGPVQISEINSGEFEYLLTGGYLALSSDMLVVVPSDVKTAWNRINNKVFNEKRKRYCLVNEYIQALNLLYAVTPVKVLLEVFNRYEKETLTEEELFTVFKGVSFYDKDIVLNEEELIDVSVAQRFGLSEFKKEIEGKSYFVPSKEMISTLGNVFNSIVIPELYELYELFVNKYSHILDEQELVNVCGYIEDEIRLGSTVNTIFEFITKIGIVFESKIELEAMRDTLARLWNNTRMIQNLGFTPNEIVDINSRIGQNVVPFRKEENKIYPNQPCPCGSGKKYKQCCKLK